LADLVYPAEVVGRRIRIKLDGKQIQKIHLEKAQQTTLEHKVDTFSHVYKTITGKEVAFEFPDPIF
jgi:small subunit ribosomal protein S7e